MPSPEEITDQQKLLAAHRRTLAHLLTQAAQYGGETFAPPVTANSIAEARANILRVKQVLRDWHVTVDDHPNDEEPPPIRGIRASTFGSSILSSRIVLAAVGIGFLAVFLVVLLVVSPGLNPPSIPTQVGPNTTAETLSQVPMAQTASSVASAVVSPSSQAIEQPTSAPNSTHTVAITPPVIPTRTNDNTKLMRLSLFDDNPCDHPAVIPAEIDPERESTTAAQLIKEAYRSDEWHSWAKAPDFIRLLQTPEGKIIGFQFAVDITSIAEGVERIRINNTMQVMVRVASTLPSHVNIFWGCERDQDIRGSPKIIALNSNNTQFTTNVQFPDGDLFTLESGEAEIFKFIMRCDAPGIYRVSVSIPYSYQGQESTVVFPERDFVCPRRFTQWYVMPADEVWTMKKAKSGEWKDTGYSIVDHGLFSN